MGEADDEVLYVQGRPVGVIIGLHAAVPPRRRLAGWGGDRDAARRARLAALQADLERPWPWQIGPERS